MTGSDATTIPTPLLEKLSLVTHHHLLTQVLFNLDLDNWNFGSWEFFFEELCTSYEVDKYLCSPINETSASSLATLTPEETTVDKTDNKRSRTNTLMAELRSIKLGDQSMESYFPKIDSIVNILNSLNACVNEEDVDTFPDLKAVRSLLIAKEIRLMSKVLASFMDSSTPMVFVAGSSNNSRPSFMSQGKSWKPCFKFAKGSYHFGNSCRYVHDANARVSNANSGFNKGCGTSKNTTNDLLTKLLAQLSHLGMNVVMSNNGTNVTLPTHATVTPTITGPNISSNVPTTPHAFTLAQVHLLAQTLHLHLGFPAVPRPCLVLSSGAVNTSGQATLLPQAFTVGTLHDPTTGAWNIDTVQDVPDCEDSRFCPSLELHILSFILGIRYPNLIDYVLSLATINKRLFPLDLRSDLSGGGLSDLDDMDDLDMIMQQVQSEQEQQEAAEWVRHKNYIYQERLDAEERLMADYFGPNSKYPLYYFRKRYRMSRKLFLEIVSSIENYIQTHHPLPRHFDFFKVRPDATGLPGFSIIMKCTSAIRQLAYGVTPDALDEYLQMSDHCAHDCLDFFTMCVIQLFMPEYLRKHGFNDIQTLYTAHNNIHGFLRMLGSIDFMYWEWRYCPKSWHVQFARGDKKYPTIMLEAVSSYDLWIWHAFFRVAGANNDLTVLNNSPLFDDLLDDIVPVALFECNWVTFEKGYYLSDGIYPQ
ncbi:transcription elongation factor SPT6 [Tanacetum coccineum]